MLCCWALFGVIAREVIPSKKGPCKQQAIEFEDENMLRIAEIWNKSGDNLENTCLGRLLVLSESRARVLMV